MSWKEGNYWFKQNPDSPWEIGYLSRQGVLGIEGECWAFSQIGVDGFVVDVEDCCDVSPVIEPPTDD